ncbi:pantetheine-phosphate adenylyltransferase [Niameybacter massiliensis]|uniref:Phosphopantetheine adenylyltransferase n=1 Tax=Holtiella tumoricola TaxID=3018743 RepID=A0AA42DQI8_9FIRM|nr:pantetheine-phosphate adenylyltransferase [Niameybacter massiliensis]MDA3733119.1 pantetheine-phosphate adenylyltransferase [Holtiella tumoricola]
MKIGVYPGSFDPITKGHMDIIERAAKLVDLLYVSVLTNPHKGEGMFKTEERMELIEKSISHLPNVKVETFSGLLVDYAKAKDADVIIRGLRAVTDFEYEMQMAQINKSLLPRVETIFLVTNAQYSFLSSSSVRELVRFNGRFHELVPEYVAGALEKRFKREEM